MKLFKKDLNKGSLIKTNEISEKTAKNMKTRVISALVLSLIALPMVFAGSWFFFVLIFAIACLAIYEIVRVPKQKKVPLLLWISMYAIVLAMLYWPFVKNSISYFINGKHPFDSAILFSNGFASVGGYGSLVVSSVIIGVAFGLFFLFTISDETFTIKDVFYYLGSTLLISLGLQSLYYLRYLPSSLDASLNDGGVNQYCLTAFLLFYLLIGSMMNDMGAYFVGVLFGKHKMNPRVSPKKTWEGFAGGIVISAILSLSFVFICDAAGAPVLKGYLDINHWYWVLVLSIGMPIIANLGDLAFSAIKRDYEIKDYGNIIPGHGGILDRIDSILFTALFVSLILMFVVNDWKVF